MCVRFKHDLEVRKGAGESLNLEQVSVSDLTGRARGTRARSLRIEKGE